MALARYEHKEVIVFKRPKVKQQQRGFSQLCVFVSYSTVALIRHTIVIPPLFIILLQHVNTFFLVHLTMFVSHKTYLCMYI